MPLHFYAGIVAITVLTLVVIALDFAMGRELPISGFFFDGRWLLFASGVAVFCRAKYASAAKKRTINGLLGGCGVALTLHYVKSPGDYRLELLAGAFFALLISLLFDKDASVSIRWYFNPIIFCGKICYSLYLIHWPVCKAISHALAWQGVTSLWETVLITLPLTLTVSVFCAWRFHLLVEHRFLPPPHDRE